LQESRDVEGEEVGSEYRYACINTYVRKYIDMYVNMNSATATATLRY